MVRNLRSLRGAERRESKQEHGPSAESIKAWRRIVGPRLVAEGENQLGRRERILPLGVHGSASSLSGVLRRLDLVRRHLHPGAAGRSTLPTTPSVSLQLRGRAWFCCSCAGPPPSCAARGPSSFVPGSPPPARPPPSGGLPSARRRRLRRRIDPLTVGRRLERQRGREAPRRQGLRERPAAALDSAA